MTLQTYSVGEVVEIDPITFTVQKVTYPKEDLGSKPEDGYKFIAVEWKLTSGEPRILDGVLISFSRGSCLKDINGQKYFFTSQDSETGRASYSGRFMFQVPENVADLVFVFESSNSDIPKIFIALP